MNFFLEVLVKLTESNGAIIALIIGFILGFLFYVMAALSYGTTPPEQLWIGVKGLVAGIWFGFTPFVIEAIYYTIRNS